MFEYIKTGFLIGLFVSIPVGPIAVLCIQRTLNKGRWHGFVTGLGAAVSDMLYASVAGLGMGFVIAFITSNQNVIQIIGSIILCFFGVYLFRSNPMKGIAPASSPQSYLQDFATAFFMTISNPMIIFLFIALYARFNFIHEGISVSKTIVGIFAIFIGASTWWFLLVSFVNLFRKKINVRGLGFINKLMGSIIIGFAIYAFVMSILGNSVL